MSDRWTNKAKEEFFAHLRKQAAERQIEDLLLRRQPASTDPTSMTAEEYSVYREQRI